MRRSLVAGFTVFLLTLQTSRPASAGAFSTEVTQLLNHGQLVMQDLRQAKQLEQAVQQTTDMIKNSKSGPGQIFGPITSDLNALASIVQGGQSLAYSLANLDSQFRSRFPGYGYPGTAYFTQYQNWSQTSLDTTLGALRADGLQGRGKPLRSGLTEWNGVEEVADDSQGLENMERETGFEPATSSLGKWAMFCFQ
jgi:P-type conjugative transfer protein TrbJ